MKFDLNEVVVVKALNKTGKVMQWRHEKFITRDSKQSEFTKYYIHFGGYSSQWYTEEELESVVNCEFDDKFELGFINLLIDVNLKVYQIDMLKELHKQKQKYIK